MPVSLTGTGQRKPSPIPGILATGTVLLKNTLYIHLQCPENTFRDWLRNLYTDVPTLQKWSLLFFRQPFIRQMLSAPTVRLRKTGLLCPFTQEPIPPVSNLKFTTAG